MDPKSVYFWLDSVSAYEGLVPSTNMVIQLTKTEKGFSGSLLGHTFQDYSPVNLAVAIAYVAEWKGLTKSAGAAKPNQLQPGDPFLAKHPNFAHHADYHDYSALLPETLKLTGHRLLLDQPKGIWDNPKASAPAVHLVSPNHDIVHNHVWDHEKRTFDGQYQAQASGITHAVKAAFEHHVGPAKPPEQPNGPVDNRPEFLRVVKSDLEKAYRPRILTTGGSGGFIPDDQPLPPGSQQVQTGTVNPNKPIKPSLTLKPVAGGGRKVTLPGMKPFKERPGPDNGLEAAVNPVLKVSKSTGHRPCGLCGEVQITQGSFVGCVCYREMAKSVTVKSTALGYTLSFGEEWDREAIAALNATFKGR